MKKSGWSLREKDKNLKPLKFSNGKTQEDVVNEILDAINQGYKTIFIKGVCGTGKSAIALNLAKNFSKSSIVVPIKNLQKQYNDDYTSKKYLLKDSGEKLKISIISGRNNYECPFLKENKMLGEENYKLSQFTDFSEVNEEEKDRSCDNPHLPCTIEIKEKNLRKIREYLKKNTKIKWADFKELKEIKRMSIAPICPYWSPVVPAEVGLNLDANRKKYPGLSGKEYEIYNRKHGCGYYNQFNAYTDSDVLIFNSLKYIIETVMDRKPATDIEIIDECDEFLDNFANSEKINLNRLGYALSSLYSKNEKVMSTIDKIEFMTKLALNSPKTQQYISKEEILPIKETKIDDLLRYFLDNDLMNSVECDEENYCYHCDEVAKTFEDFLDETYVSFYKDDRDIVAKITTISLEKKFSKLLEKNKTFVMMSGTIHSEKVLREIFGLDNFKIIEAETKMPGKITKGYTGLEMNCKYENFKNGNVTREQYLHALNQSIISSKKPTLVHINSFSDLPTKEEAEKYGLSIMTKEELKQFQEDREILKKFKAGEIKILYSTKCSRGVDFPGDMCNSIVMTKYPYPDISSAFWRILKREKPEYYSDFYMDKAGREFLQRIYRGLRSNNDHIYLYSPDIRVFQKL
jgi:Rad3-related DNA helicase